MKRRRVGSCIGGQCVEDRIDVSHAARAELLFDDGKDAGKGRGCEGSSAGCTNTKVVLLSRVRQPETCRRAIGSVSTRGIIRQHLSAVQISIVVNGSIQCDI